MNIYFIALIAMSIFIIYLCLELRHLAKVLNSQADVIIDLHERLEEIEIEILNKNDSIQN